MHALLNPSSFEVTLAEQAQILSTLLVLAEKQAAHDVARHESPSSSVVRVSEQCIESRGFH